MGAKHEDEKLLGQLPGTGGDFIDTTDVEGHAQHRRRACPRRGESVVKRGPVGPGEGVVESGPEEPRTTSRATSTAAAPPPRAKSSCAARATTRTASADPPHANTSRPERPVPCGPAVPIPAQATLSAVAASRLLTSNGVMPGWAARIRVA